VAIGLRGTYAFAALPFLCVVVGLILTAVWGSSIGRIFASPLTSMFDGGSEEIEPQPMYSIAEAKRKQGKYHEALFEVHQQLAKFPTDFTGQMMAAEIQAENLNDLPGAAVTIHRICAQPKHAPRNIAYALSVLADWHLKYDQDTEAARQALEKISEMFPETELAQNAGNRIAHLGSSQLLAQAQERPRIELKPGVEYLGLLKDQSHLRPKEKDFKTEAAELVKHLDEFPQDTEARERLAVIYGEDYGRLDFATEQLELLINHPAESPRHIVRWLNLLADLQIRCTGDTALAKETLQRIIERFPNQSFAELAQQRLMTLSIELHRYQQGRVVKFKPSEEQVPHS
jgi:outer membrane protein assembly factor BamD (BamD/ComL family)